MTSTGRRFARLRGRGRSGPSRVAADVALALAALSLVLAVPLGGVAVSLMLLVLGAVLLPRLLGLPAALDATYGLVLLVAAWSGLLGLYESIAGWDLVVHLVATGVVAATAHRALVVAGALPPLDEVARGVARAATVAVTTSVGLGLSVLWELAEWSGNAYVDGSINVGYVDTIGDMAAGGLGSAVAGVLLTRRRAARRPAAEPSVPTAAA